jgi:hemerythrin-like domain-containing protein
VESVNVGGQPVDEFRREHRTIERMLNLLERAADTLDASQEIPVDFFPDLLEFLRSFVDACHAGKEELVLFPAMESHGVAHSSGPVALILAEHDIARGHVNALAEAARHYVLGDVGAAQPLGQTIRSYTGLLRAHIQKEDTIVFPMAAELLTGDEVKAIGGQFERLERERIGDGEHERLERVLGNLEAQLPA